jgi:hypothetical protein
MAPDRTNLRGEASQSGLSHQGPLLLIPLLPQPANCVDSVSLSGCPAAQFTKTVRRGRPLDTRLLNFGPTFG